MSKITHFPLGNADCGLIQLRDDRMILIDYANTRDPDDENDTRSDLPNDLKECLKESNKDAIEIVAFTHADNDHIKGFSDFFHLEHAEKYQGDGRVVITELWVPAAIIVEKGLSGEAKILRAEARHRLRNNKGVRVFSKPEALTDWLEENGIGVDERDNLITHAGELVTGFTLSDDGVEIFVHAPFSTEINGESIDRNDAALCLHFTFEDDSQDTKFLSGADLTHEVWKDIVKITKYNDNGYRLEWDTFKISHHCSYLSLGPDCGKNKTDPIDEVEWLLEQGRNKGVLISSSDPIPSDDTEQPPHKQAAAYYREVESKIDGNFVVTMENPSSERPKPVEVEIDKSGATLKKQNVRASNNITRRPAPRAG